MQLTEDTVRDLLSFRDELGVLSIYVEHSPGQAADRQPAAPILIRNELRAVRQRLLEAHPHDHRRTIESRLDELESAIDALVDPSGPGRGRALFVALTDGRREEVRLQIPFHDRVVLHGSAFVRPLVAALDEGRPAGIVVVHRGGSRLLEWRLGEVDELDAREFVLTDAQLADVEAMYRDTGQKDAISDRLEENHHRFLKSVAQDAAKVAAERSWDRLIAAGPPKVRSALVDELSIDNATTLIVAEQTWEETAPHQIAAEAWPVVRSVHRERERELVRLAEERALGGKAGALGLRAVTRALNEGRVEHLLYASGIELSGYVADDGSLHAEVSGPIAESDLRLEREALFVERLIEKALATSARITPVDEDVAAALGEHGGVAALLRW